MHDMNIMHENMMITSQFMWCSSFVTCGAGSMGSMHSMGSVGSMHSTLMGHSTRVIAQHSMHSAGSMRFMHCIAQDVGHNTAQHGQHGRRRGQLVEHSFSAMQADSFGAVLCRQPLYCVGDAEALGYATCDTLEDWGTALTFLGDGTRFIMI